jgi:hypothetical protein
VDNVRIGVHGVMLHERVTGALLRRVTILNMGGIGVWAWCAYRHAPCAPRLL